MTHWVENGLEWVGPTEKISGISCKGNLATLLPRVHVAEVDRLWHYTCTAECAFWLKEVPFGGFEWMMKIYIYPLFCPKIVRKFAFWLIVPENSNGYN